MVWRLRPDKTSSNALFDCRRLIHQLLATKLCLHWLHWLLRLYFLTVKYKVKLYDFTITGPVNALNIDFLEHCFCHALAMIRFLQWWPRIFDLWKPWSRLMAQLVFMICTIKLLSQLKDPSKTLLSHNKIYHPIRHNFEWWETTLFKILMTSLKRSFQHWIKNQSLLSATRRVHIEVEVVFP